MVVWCYFKGCGLAPMGVGTYSKHALLFIVVRLFWHVDNGGAMTAKSLMNDIWPAFVFDLGKFANACGCGRLWDGMNEM